MQISQDNVEPHAIRSYGSHYITIGDTDYTSPCLISREEIIQPWAVNRIQNLNEASLSPVIKLNPDVLLIGHDDHAQCPIEILAYLSQHQIGLECMSIGAACRTFNILLSEGRSVMVGFIF